MAISNNSKADEGKVSTNNVELSRLRQNDTENSSQPTAPLIHRSSWIENIGQTIWKQRSFRQSNNGDTESKRSERRHRYFDTRQKKNSIPPNVPPPPVPKRQLSEHEYASPGPPPVYGVLSTTVSKRDQHKKGYTYGRCDDRSPDSSSSLMFKRIAIGLGILCFFLLSLTIVLLVCLFSRQSQAAPGELSITEIMSGHANPSELIFYDDFDDTLNMTTWRHDRYFSNDGFVLYGSSSNNSYTKNGILFIQPTFTEDLYDRSFLYSGTIKIGTTIEQEEGCSSFIPSECEKRARGYEQYSILNPIISASLRTSQSFTFKYGIIEMRAKMPKGDWISTEISLLPKYNYYGEPPVNTEKITLVKIRGNPEYISFANRTNYGNERVCSQLTYNGESGTRTVTEFCTNTLPGQGYGEDYHIYRYEWTPDFLKIFIDGKLAGKFVVVADAFLRSSVRHIAIHGDAEEEIKKVSFDQQFYLQMRLSVAEGFPDSGIRAAYARPWTADPHKTGRAPYTFWYNKDRWQRSWQNESSCLQVDYIRVKAL